MDDLTIVHLGTPVLRLQAQEVQELDGDVRELARRMLTTMYTRGGQGLAAPQVGVSRRIAVVDVPLPCLPHTSWRGRWAWRLPSSSRPLLKDPLLWSGSINDFGRGGRAS